MPLKRWPCPASLGRRHLPIDVPGIHFPTPGHPCSVEKARRMEIVADRQLLDQARVRYYGDDSRRRRGPRTAVTARPGLASSGSEYEDEPVCLDPEEPRAEAAACPSTRSAPTTCSGPQWIPTATCPSRTPSNATARSTTCRPAAADAPLPRAHYRDADQVQHCHHRAPHRPTPTWTAGRITVVVTSTQIPHICPPRGRAGARHPVGVQIRVIKPYIGGGFGNKQEVLLRAPRAPSSP